MSSRSSRNRIVAVLAVGGVAVALGTATLGTVGSFALAAAPTAAGTVVQDGATGFHYYGHWATRGPLHLATGRAAVAFRFTGTSASLTGHRLPGGGRATVRLDGRRVATVDFAAGTEKPATLYRTPTLAPGAHRIELIAGASGRTGTIDVDQAVVTGARQATAPTADAGDPTVAARRAGGSTGVTTGPTGSGTGGIASPMAHGVASLSFDDSLAGQAVNAVPILKSNNAPATFYLISQAYQSGDAGYMTLAQEQQLVASGYEIGNHSSKNYNLVAENDGTLPTEFGSAQADLDAAQKLLTMNLGVTPTTCAYPQGIENAAVEKAAANVGLKGCRGTVGGDNYTVGLKTFNLNAVQIDRTTTVQQITDAVTKAKNGNTWVTFVWHDIVPSPVDQSAITPAAFTAQLKAIKDSGIALRTVGAQLAYIRLQTPKPPSTPTPPPTTGGLVSLSFDDGFTGELTNGVPILKKYGFNATFYLISEAPQWGDPNYLSVAQQKQLVTGGYEIGNHSSQHYDLVAEDDGSLPTEFGSAQADLDAAQKLLTSNLGVAPLTCAYPEGRENANVEKAAANVGLKGCRGTQGGDNSTSLNAYDIAGITVDQSTTTQQVADAVATAKQNHTWVVFLWHNIVPSPTDQWAITPAALDAQLKVIKDSGVTVQPVGAALAAFRG
jgi:peptidoglycan/xylan/chitin deacetylase (PgdA/CDA1 family)